MSTDKGFRGDADASPLDCVVVRTGGSHNIHPLRPRRDLIDHSPTGYGWGYGGSGPAQLALAMLAEATGDDALAVRLHHEFKWDVVAKLPLDRSWTLSVNRVLAWVERQVPTAEEAAA